MAKTFNRIPAQFNTPSSNDVKSYFFNHHNWKGVCKNDNFLAVDQETFEDSNNIYVNAEGLLRSRPAIKRREVNKNKIQQIWAFGDIIVKLYKNCTLEFYDKDTLKYTGQADGLNIKLYYVNGKIFIFFTDSFKYYDPIKNGIFDAKIYIPTTKVDTLGIETQVEDKNVLTSQEIYTYLYNSQDGYSKDLIGKKVSAELNGTNYEFVFDPSKTELIVDEVFNIPDGFEVIISNKNTYALYNKSERNIYYSTTGKVFNTIHHINEEFGEIIGIPKFSQNGNYIIISTAKSVYIVSVVSDFSDGLLRFEKFTDIQDIFDITLPIDNFHPNVPEGINVLFDFFDYNDFVITFNHNPDCYLCIYNNNSYKEIIYEGECDRCHHLSYSGVSGIIYLALSPRYLKNGIEIIISSSTYENLYNKTYYDNNTNLAEVMDVRTVLDSAYIVLYRNLLDTDAITYEFCKIYNSDSEYVKDVKNVNLSIYTDRKFVRLSSDLSKIAAHNEIYYIETDSSYKIMGKFNRPHTFNDFLYGYGLGKLVSSNIQNTLELNYTKPGENKYILPNHISTLGNHYLSVDNKLYISSYREDKNGDIEWYLPEINKQTFDDEITNLHPISTSEMGVFLNDEIWYVSLTESGYTYTKSKLPLGLKEGSDVMTAFDGSTIMFCSERGFVGLNYQDFVASSDQILSVLSDNIYSDMKEYCKEPVRLFSHGYWILLYKSNSDKGYIFDIRSQSWWPVSYKPVNKIITCIGEPLLLCDGNLYDLDKGDKDYYDFDGNKSIVDWYVVSQKLYLAMNYYKHIVNMTLSSVSNGEDELSFNLDILNYRKNVNNGKAEIIHYEVDVIRTFVKRLNYFKVNEFQYMLSTDKDNFIQLPLSLSNITIKYKVQGQVR